MGVEETLSWMWDVEHRNRVDQLDAQDPRAYVMNARAELEALRADVVNELSMTAGDFHLRAAFLSYIDAADLNLQKALR